MLAIGLLVVAASVYLVYVLEILKFRRLDAIRLRRLRPEASPAEIDLDVAKHLETGEFQAVAHAGDGDAHVARRRGRRAGLSSGSASGRWMRTA